jgi:hypothetical protein
VPEKNDSPNGIVMDAMCVAAGALVGATANYLVYVKQLPKIFDFLNGLMIVTLPILMIILALQKSKQQAFGPGVYGAVMTLVGWGIGTFIVVELQSK